MSEHKHTNRLSKETSPYLLQHAHNPVDWYAWGEEAFQKARDEDKPILLSIGYAACHWCHVMERESFENEQIAGLMNELFVNIKVDREERPDVDQIYMTAVQLMQRHGGWPLTVFLTPDLVPFYGGTYFPPEDRHNMPGFPRILRLVADAYLTRREEIAEGGAELVAEIQRQSSMRESSGEISHALLDDAAQVILRTFDQRHGGFGGAPKFPAPMVLDFLLRTYKRTGNQQALAAVTLSCRKMAEGGLYDHLGGGFHRYSTDARWLVPHFEKMLYDNAQLSRLYLRVYQETGETFFRVIAEQTLEYVLREMTSPEGGFYSTQDADSEGVEGKFFVWDLAEIVELLGEDEGRLFAAYYGSTEEGNFEEKNILNVTRSIETVARENGVTAERLTEVLERGRRTLFEARERRIKPARDEKILAAWNGMMLESFSLAATVCRRDDYREAAERCAEFLFARMLKEDSLLHVYKDGQAKHVGFLDDYACVSNALVSLFEVTGNVEWLEKANSLTARMIEEFWDADEGGFFYTGRSGERLIVRTKDFFDNATPSGNSVAAEVLLKLSVLTGNEGYRRHATTLFRLTREMISRYPSAFGHALGALDFYLSTPKEIVIVGPERNDAARKLFEEVWRHYVPNMVLVQGFGTDERARKLIPLLEDRAGLTQTATAFVCEHYACLQPVTTPEELASQLG